MDRRNFLACMAWAGTGLVVTMRGGVAASRRLEDSAVAANASDFTFVQLSDSHMGFDKAANPDVAGTFQEAVAKVNALPQQPDFVIHTGDLTHLSKPAEFDAAANILKGLRTSQVFHVPGEHDVVDDAQRLYFDRYRNKWYSFDHKGVHFIGLVNVLNLKAGGLGFLGNDQVEWLEDDVKHLSSSTPIVVFAHMPLWALYPSWGWGTDDSERALSYLRRFGSVTVLNGHIHQAVRKVEGNITFHTALATAYPQPAAGVGPGPGPLKVEPGRLREVIGTTEVYFQKHKSALAVMDDPLAQKAGVRS